MNPLRTKEDAKKMMEAIELELDSLPEKNIFGESNEESRREMEEWRGELFAFIETGKLPEDVWSETYLWLEGKKHSSLNDITEI